MPNQQHIETQIPAIQAEQVEDDVAPVTAEYVPTKASHEEFGVRRFEDKRLGEHTKGGGETLWDENMFGSTRARGWGVGGVGSLLSCIILPGGRQDKSTRQDTMTSS